MTAQTRPGDGGAPSSPDRPLHVGRSIHRIEDAALLTGRTRAVADVRVDGMLHLALLRSPVAHARIGHLDVSAALDLPGVVAAFDGDALREHWVEPIPAVAPAGTATPWQLPVAVSRVRFAGEPLAVVVATSEAAAVDAVEAVDVDLDPLEVVVDPLSAASAPTLLHEDVGSNVAFRFDGQRVGDIDAVLADAEVVVHRRLEHPRVMGAALEPRATLAIPADDGRLVLHVSTQVPHRFRDQLAHALGLDPGEVRVIAEHVGGGFGVKLDVYLEDLITAAVARRLGRPVRYVATRSEDLQNTHHGRGQIQDITVAANRDGILLALDVAVTADCGAYVSRAGANVPLNGDKIFPGSYRWQAYRFGATGVFTNAVPTGAYRGAGRPEATYGVERIIDELAVELGLDPAELRRRNLPAGDEFPFASIGGLTYDSGDYQVGLARALEAAGYDELRDEQRRRRAAGDPVVLGIGLSSYVDRCAPGPGMPEYASIEVDADGTVEVLSGLGPTGQGTATTLAQVVADELGVGMDDIRVVHGDTDRVPQGTGSFGSRSVPVGAVAALLAARDVAEQARNRAADRLEVDAGDVELRDGRVVVRGAPSHGIELGEIVGDEGLRAVCSHEPAGLVFPYGTHVAVVEIDTATGMLQLLRYVAVDDAGTVINPALYAGQQHGGIAQGIAQAVQEAAVYDESGNLVTGTFLDYTIPRGPDLPTFEVHSLATPGVNPLGAKGIAEAGSIAAPAAVVNAAIDAVRHLGVDDLQMPLTPLRVWEALHSATRPLAS